MTSETIRSDETHPPAPESWTKRGMAQSMFNASIAASSVAALDELGFFDELAGNGAVQVSDFCAARGLHEMSVGAYVHAIACFDVVTVSGDEVGPGPHFDDLLANKGYFLWLIRGYGGMLRDLPVIAHEASRTGDFIERDGKSIALAGKDYGARFVDADFAAVLGQEDFRSAADLGCGSGQRLIRLAEDRPEFRGVGVEFDAGAARHAQARVEDMGLSDRVSIVQGDVSKLVPEEAFEDIDVVFSFFMAHDLWPRQRCVESLNGIAAAFPNTERFLLCDTYRSELPPSEGVPIFTLGFEVTHAAMGQRVPSKEEWLDLFHDTAWTLRGTSPIGIPYSSIFDLRRDID